MKTILLTLAVALAVSPAARGQAANRPLMPPIRLQLSAFAADSAKFIPASWQDGEEGAQDRAQEAQDRGQQARDHAQEARDREQGKRDQQSALYQRGTEALDQSQWQKAVDAFSEATQTGGDRTEGALYWKAYAQDKLGRRADALTTLSQIKTSFPNGRWTNEAKALELEVRQSAGQNVSPESESNEDLKLIAINSLLGSDPDRALPLLEGILKGSQSPRIKERALFVLSQSGSPRARELVMQIAQGKGDPDLQAQALKYLGLFGGEESRKELADIYASSNDPEVKRSILQSFMISGDRERLLAIARTEKSPELRRDAINQLGVMGAQDELWQLYQQEPSVDIKEHILHSLFIGGNSSKLLEVARNEKDPRLRRAAIQSLGLMGASKTGDALVSIYASEKDPEVRRAVINSLFIQGNAHPLIEIARQEKNEDLKRDAVQKLSLMKSKEATDYMLEILNK